MTQKAFQDFYPAEVSVCYGCGRQNEHGLKIRSYWDGDESVARFSPEPYHTAFPGYVYGGLLASLIDCHGTATASAAAYREQSVDMVDEPFPRFVTASLNVDFIQPTPMGVELEIRGRIKELHRRKVIVAESILAEGRECVRGEVVAVRMPEHMKQHK